LSVASDRRVELCGVRDRAVYIWMYAEVVVGLWAVDGGAEVGVGVA
jgi:hypothetical protein